MHKIILGMLLLSSTLFSLDQVKDVHTAFDIAKKENKNVMIFVEADYCSWCKKMKRRTLTEDSVVDRLSKFVVVNVDRDDADLMTVVSHIDGVPTTLFLDKNEKLLESAVGYKTVRSLHAIIDHVEKMTK